MATKESLATSVVSGTFAGLAADLSLFPVDTIKTRLQSKHGFINSSGFRGVYQGFGSCAIGSIPGNALFFVAYDLSKLTLPTYFSSDAIVHLVLGAIGEITSISAKMPFEVVKQTAQASKTFTSRTAFLHVLRTNGLTGLYSGYFSTIYRDVPFSAMLMPMWEYFKVIVKSYSDADEVTGLQSGVCGGIASAVSAFITTPMDVAKTRIILSYKTEADYTENPFQVIRRIFHQEGFSRLFSGVVPRVGLMTIAGVIYFGAYGFAITQCQYFIGPVTLSE